MDKVTIEITSSGWTETLEFDGRKITKRYESTSYGWQGLDKEWDGEDIPDALYEAFSDQRTDEIMDALGGLDEEESA